MGGHSRYPGRWPTKHTGVALAFLVALLGLGSAVKAQTAELPSSSWKRPGRPPRPFPCWDGLGGR